MAAIGKALVFYLKYFAEMQRLYVRDDTTTETVLPEGLEDSDRILEMVDVVGDAASGEAADFLEACAEKIEARISAADKWTVRRTTKRPRIEDYWTCHSKVVVAPSKDPAFTFGVDISWDCKALPWIWVRGGYTSEELLAGILAQHSSIRRSRELESYSGTVALAQIPILPDEHEGFDLDREAIVDRVVKAFAEISVEEWRSIARIKGA